MSIQIAWSFKAVAVTEMASFGNFYIFHSWWHWDLITHQQLRLTTEFKQLAWRLRSESSLFLTVINTFHPGVNKSDIKKSVICIDEAKDSGTDPCRTPHVLTDVVFDVVDDVSVVVDVYQGDPNLLLPALLSAYQRLSLLLGLRLWRTGIHKVGLQWERQRVRTHWHTLNTCLMWIL